jgi:Ca2+-binding EF-hand superfamily protein
MEKTIRDQQAVRAKRLRQLLNAKQKADIKDAFDHFDQGGAGKIRKKELKVILRALGFDPSNEELDKLMQGTNGDNTTDSIDFQEFMDIMLTKIEEKLSPNDIKYAFKKIAECNMTEEEKKEKEDMKKKNKEKKKDKKKEKSDLEKKELYITHEDLRRTTLELGEKLTNEEIDEMLQEAINAGILLKKNKSTDKKKDEKVSEQADGFENDSIVKKQAASKDINLYEFKAILTWENN